MIVSKIAAVCALGVALFPCGCGNHQEIIPHLHYISAGVLFILLAFFCRIFYKRAIRKGHKEAQRRAVIYVICGVTILASIALLLIDFVTHESISSHYARLTFQCERAALVAFGVSWLIASRVLPYISAKEE